jgi:hypothetical protein
VCVCACVCERVALLIQHAKRMRHILVSGLSVSTTFSALSHKMHCLKKLIEYKMCVLIFSTTLSEIFLIPRRTQRDIVINVKTSSCKVPIILVSYSNNNTARYCHKCDCGCAPLAAKNAKKCNASIPT